MNIYSTSTLGIWKIQAKLCQQNLLRDKYGKNVFQKLSSKKYGGKHYAQTSLPKAAIQATHFT